MKISIIIPAYQMEEYLAACVESVIMQTYQDYEIILVDDGSTDRTGIICDQYSRRNKRIKSIHQQNKGLSDARNTGIVNASGEYVLFLDADDYWLSKDSLEKLVARTSMTQADITCFDFKKVSDYGQMSSAYFDEKESMPLNLTKEKQVEYLANRGLYIACAWNKMIRRSLFDKELFFEKGIYSEDIDWCARLMLKAGSFDYFAQQIYGYRQRSTSIRHTINDKKCCDLTDNIMKCFALVQKANDAEKQALLQYTAFQYGTFFMVQAQSENPQPACIQRLAPYKWVLKHHGKNKKLLGLHLSCSTIGYRATCALIRCIYGRTMKK